VSECIKTIKKSAIAAIAIVVLYLGLVPGPPHTYFVETSIDLAIRFFRPVDLTVRDLAQQPEIGSPRQLSSRPGTLIRVWPIKDFRDVLMLYHVTDTSIEIIRVLHSRQDWRNIVG
jgi:toxin ParE1/3/4